MKYSRKDIVFDDQPQLREICEEVTLPLDQETIQMALGLREYVINSTDEQKAEEMDLAPAVGIAAPQIGVNKRVCAINFKGDVEAQIPDVDLILINPTIISHSRERIYLEGGEACLSVAEKKEGFVPRYAAIKIRYIDIKGHIKTHEAFDFEAIVIQHEIDHLDGILFYDRINKDDPFKIPANSFAL